jgi:VWFA-related protein
MHVGSQGLSIRNRNTVAAILMAAFLSPSSLRSQQAPTPDIKVKVRLVTLDVVVTDKKGNLVTNLNREDFQVYEDAQRQAVRTFEPPSAHLMPGSPDGKPRLVVTSAADLPRIGNAPVTVLVLDELNTGFSDMSFARQSLEKFLRAQPEILNQPTALLVANNTKFQLLQDYTQKRADVLAALKTHFPDYPWKMANGGKGGSNAVERIVQSLSSLLQIAEATRGTPGRKNVVWVGVNAPGVDLSNADPVTIREMNDVVKRVTQTLLATRVAVYYIDPTINSSATVGIMVPDDSDGGDTFVDTDPFSADINFNEFAPATGGKIFASRNDVNNEIATSIDNGNTYYSISYSPSNKSEDAAKFRNIKIKFSNPNLIATTREGYYPEGENANNAETDSALSATQRKSTLQMELSQAAVSMMAYNGLSVAAQKSADKKLWQISVDGKNLSWTPAPNGMLVAEVTAMAVAFDDRGNGGKGKYREGGKSKMLGHVSRELQSERTADSSVGTVVFQLPVEIPSNATRMRMVMRDAVSGRIGTFDATP